MRVQSISDYIADCDEAIYQLQEFLKSRCIITDTKRESCERFQERLERVKGSLRRARQDPQNATISDQDILDAKHSLQLVKKYMKVEMFIPFQRGFSPGRPIHLFRFPYETCQPHQSAEKSLAEKEVKSVSGRFCIASSFRDVCETLNIHPIYALQVEVNLIKNKRVTSCLETIKDPQNICLIFHLSYVWKTLYIKEDEQQFPSEHQSHANSGNASNADHSDSPNATPRHLITSLDLGNELTVICSIADNNPSNEQVPTLRKELLSCLKAETGTLDQITIDKLKTSASRFDEIFEKAKVNFEYHTYSNFRRVPQTLKEVMEAVEEFMTNSTQQTLTRSSNGNCQQGSCSGELRVQQCQHKHISLNDTGTKRMKAPQIFEDHGDNLMCEQQNGLRAAVQPFEEICFEKAEPAKQGPDIIEILYKTVLSNEEASRKLEEFLSSKTHWRKTDKDNGTRIQSELASAKRELHGFISNLDFSAMPPETETNNIKFDLLQTVEGYIEEVSLKLPPPGEELSLLMFGKTGHGKSQTGNSIMGRKVFETSDGTQSLTQSCSVAYRILDERTIRIVDTPGICDTSKGGEAVMHDMSKEDFFLSVASCPEGFNAILLFWKYSDRLTWYERMGIQILRKAWGEDVLQNYGVVVFTYGDIYKTVHGKCLTFDEWCEKQSGPMKDLLEECGRRYVLFDNMTTDKKEKKRQLCKLVECIDQLPTCGIHFQNKQFKSSLQRYKELYKEKFDMDMKISKSLYLISANLNNGFGDGGKFDTACVFQILTQIEAVLPDFECVLIQSSKNEKVLCLLYHLNAIRRELTNKQVEIERSGQCTPLDEQVMRQFKASFSAYEDEVKSLITEPVAKELQSTTACFPGSSQVIVDPLNHKTLEELQVGDKVLVRNESGHLVYETVYMFGHCDPLSVTEFLALETRHQQLLVTKDHLVFCHRDGFELCIAAKHIKEGDGLLILSHDGLTIEQVLRISCQTKRGLYAPFTKTGTLIVDDALSSCYMGILTHEKAHKLLLPMRVLYQVWPSMLKFINGKERGKVIPPWATMYLKWKMRH